MGGAQPLAATMNGAVFLGVEVDPARIEKRLKSGYCDKIAHSLDEALKLIDAALKDRQRSRRESIDFGRTGWQLCRCFTGNCEARRCSRCSDRSNERA